jgi:hypothetical protein
MNIPQFTAQSSLYRTSNRYRSSGPEGGNLWSGDSVVPAYNPGPAAQAACNKCADSALGDYFKCIAFEGFPLSLVHCTLRAWWDAGACIVDDCCPKRCGPPDIWDLAGSGCCDAGDTCVAKDDPNSRYGCCPSNQSVCGGRCCAIGEYCCGDTCCGDPKCYHGMCGADPPFTDPDNPPPPPPPPPVNNCIFGGAPCGPKCCPPGLQCCNYSAQFGPECRTSCVN